MNYTDLISPIIFIIFLCIWSKGEGIHYIKHISDKKEDSLKHIPYQPIIPHKTRLDRKGFPIAHYIYDSKWTWRISKTFRYMSITVHGVNVSLERESWMNGGEGDVIINTYLMDAERKAISVNRRKGDPVLSRSPYFKQETVSELTLDNIKSMFMWAILSGTGFAYTGEVMNGIDYSILDNWKDILMWEKE